MNNIEIKAPLSSMDAMARRAESLGAVLQGVLHQIDTFFNVAIGYLKLRDLEGRGAELIAYSREPGNGPRVSDYVVASITDVDRVLEALTRCLGVRGRVEKARTLYLWKHTRIHLDDVVGLGPFLELETVMDGISRDEAEAESWSIIRALDLDPGTFLDVPYLELLETEGSVPPPVVEAR
jgi:predicted adenylyl cyclase CyaB